MLSRTKIIQWTQLSVEDYFDWLINKFTRNEKMTGAPDSLKDKFTSPPVLTFTDFDRSFFVDMNAYSFAAGTVMAQEKEWRNTYTVKFASPMVNSGTLGNSLVHKYYTNFSLNISTPRPLFILRTYFSIPKPIFRHDALFFYQKKYRRWIR